jgi:DNA primase
MGLCPFPNHKERTASFSVNQDKQVYHCFGCKESGNLVTYLRVIRGMNFPEAVEFLAQRASLPIPVEEQSPTAPSEGQKDKKKVLSRINEWAASFFHRQLLALPPSHPVKEYLTKRGISSEAVTQFEIGYAPDGWEALSHALESQKIPLHLAQELGLVKSRSQGKTGYFDIFRHRLMFPIVSPAGHHIGFGGRVLKDEQPKYLNSPESEIFHKGKILYGLNETAKYVRSEDQAIVVEGYTDFLALYMAGVKNVVATLGTALTENHAKLLRRYTKNILVLFDGDNAGQMAAERSLPILLAQGLYPKAFSLPDKKDPDEFIKAAGAEAFRLKAAEAKDLFIHIFEEKNRGVGAEASDKVKMLDQVGPILSGMIDLRLKELYIDEMALRWSVAPGWIKKSLAQGQPAMTSMATPNARPAPQKAASVADFSVSVPKPPAPDSPKSLAEGSKIQLKGAPKEELWLVNAALIRAEAWERVKDSGILPQVSHEGLRQVFQRIDELYGQMPNKFDSLTSLLLAEVEPSGALALHLDPSFQLSEEGLRKMIQDCVERIRAKAEKKQLRQIRDRLRNKKGSESLEDLEQIMNIHRGRKPPDSET